MSATPAQIPQPPLSLAVSIEDGVATIKCTGKLMAGVTDILRAEVKRLIPNHKRIVLDLTELTLMDSMGLGTIVSLYASARKSGSRLELINLSKRVRELFGLTNLLSMFELCGEHDIRMP
jgi:anti-anti-sigma factor